MPSLWKHTLQPPILRKAGDTRTDQGGPTGARIIPVLTIVSEIEKKALGEFFPRNATKRKPPRKVFVAKTAKGSVRVCQKYVGETDYEPPHGIVACF